MSSSPSDKITSPSVIPPTPEDPVIGEQQPQGEGESLDQISSMEVQVLANQEGEGEGSEENNAQELDASEIDLELEEVAAGEDESELIREESNVEMELDAGDDDHNEDEENEVGYPVPQFPISRVKKIMGICIHTEEEAGEEEDNAAKTKSKGKGSGTGTMIITKEAAYLMSLAAEYFVGVVGETAGRITVSSKKKTMNLEHLKRALSDTEAFAFLEGCFQPSIIIGD